MMKTKILILITHLFYLSVLGQNDLSIPTIESINYREIHKYGEKKLVVFIKFNKCEACYKITDERLEVYNDKGKPTGYSASLQEFSSNLLVYSIQRELYRESINLIFTYRVNQIEKKLEFPIYKTIPKLDEEVKANVVLSLVEKYDDYIEAQFYINGIQQSAIEKIIFNKNNLSVNKQFKIIKRKGDDFFIIRINDKNVVHKFTINNEITLKVKPLGYVYSNESNKTLIVKGNSLKIDKIELKNTLTNSNYIEYKGDIFEVNNGYNYIKIKTSNNTVPIIKLTNQKREQISFNPKIIDNTSTDNIFIYRFKLGDDCCAESGAYKLFVILSENGVTRKKEILIKKETQNYVTKLTYDNRFDKILLTIKTINPLDIGVEPVASINDSIFSSTIGKMKTNGLKEFRFNSIQLDDERLYPNTSNTIYFNLDKDPESDFNFEFYFLTEKKIEEIVNEAIKLTDNKFSNASVKKRKKIIKKIKEDKISRTNFTENLKASLEIYLGQDKKTQDFLKQQKISDAQAMAVLESIIVAIDTKPKKGGFWNSGFGKVITSVVDVLPKALPVILAL